MFKISIEGDSLREVQSLLERLAEPIAASPHVHPSQVPGGRALPREPAIYETPLSGPTLDVRTEEASPVAAPPTAPTAPVPDLSLANEAPTGTAAPGFPSAATAAPPAEVPPAAALVNTDDLADARARLNEHADLQTNVALVVKILSIYVANPRVTRGVVYEAVRHDPGTTQSNMRLICTRMVEAGLLETKGTRSPHIVTPFGQQVLTAANAVATPLQAPEPAGTPAAEMVADRNAADAAPVTDPTPMPATTALPDKQSAAPVANASVTMAQLKEVGLKLIPALGQDNAVARLKKLLAPYGAQRISDVAPENFDRFYTDVRNALTAATPTA